MKVNRQLHVTIDEDGEPVSAYELVRLARHAVESDAYRHEDEVDYVPDVPLMIDLAEVDDD